MAAVNGSASAALLRVDGLSVAARVGGVERPLVSDVGFTVRAGEAVAIVGESGSGKSMTAAAILGLLPRNVTASGSATFKGRELIGRRSAGAVRGSGISLLLQDPFTMLNPVHRCIAHVEESLERHATSRMGRAERRAEALRRLAEVGISPAAARRYPFQISGGMAQRVGIAAALAGEPEILIADEPTTALDVTTQREILGRLNALRESRGMSLVLITHDLRVAFEVCDRVYVFYAGSVVEQAPAAELAEQPLHPYSVGLLASEPSLIARRKNLTGIPGSVPRPDTVRDCCSFAARCTWRIDACESGRPPLAPVAPERASACLRVPGLNEELRHALGRDLAEAADSPARAPGAAVLEVDVVRKAFPARGGTVEEVVKGVSLTVGRGESVGLVGESGSGKTTLARCIVGLACADAGQIVVGGVDVSDWDALSGARTREARGKVQMVFQNPYASLNPARTVAATLREALQAGGRPTGRGAEAELLEMVNLPAAYARKLPGALSGGQRQRVALARALAVEPDLLVCDEPVSALDVSVQAQILTLLRRLQTELDLALLFITHDLGVVRQVADRVYVMASGELVENGATADVLDNPRHEYTRLLLESVPGVARDVAVARADARVAPPRLGESTT